MTTVDEAWERLTHGENSAAPGDENRKALFEAGWNAVIDALGGVHHIMKITRDGWMLQHPITERLEGTLFDCTLPGVVKTAYEEGQIPNGTCEIWIEEDVLRWREI